MKTETILRVLRKIRIALTFRSKLIKTKMPNGTIVCGINRPGYGGRGIYLLREAIEPEFTHLEKFLDVDGVFLDVGANTGIYTIKAAKHYSSSSGLVIAMEPFPEVFAVLYHNIKLNGFKNVHLRNACAGDSTGVAELYLNSGKPNNFGLIRRDSTASSISSLVLSIDDLLHLEKVERLDYLKIDVEGAEAAVLKGASKAVMRFRPIIQCETSPTENKFNLIDYVAYRAKPNSANIVYFPRESNKITVADELNWVPA